MLWLFLKTFIRFNHCKIYDFARTSKSGIHNYEDRLFLGIDVCFYLRKHLLTHNSISSLVDLYNSMFDTNIVHLQLLDL